MIHHAYYFTTFKTHPIETHDFLRVLILPTCFKKKKTVKSPIYIFIYQ